MCVLSANLNIWRYQMSKGNIVALGVGIIIGAAGMWFVDNSKQPTYQVDEVIEGYSMPADQMNNAPANHMDTTKPATGNNMDHNNMNMDHNNMNMDNTAPAATPPAQY
jgi:hypothetical protein